MVKGVGWQGGAPGSLLSSSREVDVRLPGKGNSSSDGARPVHLIIKWIQTSRLSIKNSLSYCKARPVHLIRYMQ